MSNVLDGLRGVVNPGDARLADVSDYLAERAPELLIRLGEVLSTARSS